MKKILIIAANYYPKITNDLIAKSKKALKSKYKIETIKAPGVFEVPYIISKYINKYDAFIALGCVIKGETPHFDFISTSVNNGLMNLSIMNKKPIGNGILTCLNKKQALKRISKGFDAALAVDHILNNVPK
tara:strand:+ start:26 stop:418 length:393 start_codon:yes stop_codon:yes gene_type:complete